MIDISYPLIYYSPYMITPSSTPKPLSQLRPLRLEASLVSSGQDMGVRVA